MTTPTQEKAFPSDERVKLPRPFILRRLHSILGVWLVVYLFEHLLVNSQMALFFQDDGAGFVSMVNKIHDLPYLKVIEILFLAIPFLIHGVWGIFYALSSKLNSGRSKGTRPSLPQYKRNRAFSWQRITSWLLVVGILAHVIQFRFVDYPTHAQKGDQRLYMTRLSFDKGLFFVAQKLGVHLFDNEQLNVRRQALSVQQEELKKRVAPETYVPNDPYSVLQNSVDEKEEWLAAAGKKPLKDNQILAVAPSAGAAFFLIVRQVFTNPLLVILYSILVVAATYHAFNGLWTFMITWGLTLTRRSQKTMRVLTTTLMGVVMFMGLMSAWGTYWTTLLQQ